MTVFLGILSVIGKVLLIAVLILLVLLLLVLFVPVRYRAEGERGDQGITVSVRVTWLLHALSLRFFFSKTGEKTEKGRELRIFGISPAAIKAARARRKKEKGRRRRKKELQKLKEKNPGKYQQLRDEARRKKEAEREAMPADTGNTAASETAEPERDTDKRQNPPEPLQEMAESGSEKPVAGRRFFRHMHEILAQGWRFLLSLPVCIFRLISDFHAKAEEICAKINRWVILLTDPRFSGAVSFALKDLKKLLRHAGPRKASGYLKFGLGDPAATGEILGLLLALRPYAGSGMDIHADFERKELTGKMDARGRIVLGYVGAVALGALLNKNVRYLIHFLRGRKGETHVGD